MPDKKEFARNLNKLMELRGVNPTELAKRTKKKKQQISRYVHGQQIPDRKIVEAIADALDATAEELYGSEETEDVDKRKLAAIRAITLCSAVEFNSLWVNLRAIVDNGSVDQQQPAR